MEGECRGKRLLQFSGLLLIVFGAFSVLVDLISLAGFFFGVVKALQISYVLFWANFAVYGLMAVTFIIAGIRGIRFSGIREKADACVRLGVFLLLITAGAQVLNFVYGSNAGTGMLNELLSAACALVLPVLYIAGARQNQR